MSTKAKILSEIPAGETFKVGDFEFIKFTDENGATIAVSKNILFDRQFGKNNNFSESYILEKLIAEILPEIERVVGTENVIEFDTDLLSLDGSHKHGSVKSKISIPTFDFYRQNRAIFEKYKVNKWWWLATPDSTREYNNDNWNVCVAPSGRIDYDYYYYYNFGVRPILTFVSSISVSFDE